MTKNDIPLRIFTVLADSDKPLGRKDICIITGIQPQLFDYWCSYLIQNNVLIQTDRKKYTVQPTLKDKELPLLLIPFIKKIASELKINKKTDTNLNEYLSANLSLYMKYLSGDL